MKDQKSQKDIEKAQQPAEEHYDLVEKPEALQEKLTEAQFWAEKYKNAIIGAGIAVILVVAGGLFYSVQQEKQDKIAQAELSQAIFLLEKDSVDKALAGDGNFTKGFEKIASEYSGKAGKLANFYAGVAYMKKGDYDKAIAALDKFSADDMAVQARAYSLIGDAYVEKKDYAKAISYFEKAVSYKENKQFTPAYMVKLALAQEAAGNKAAALKTFQQIDEKFPESPEAAEAKKSVATLEVQ